MSMTLVGIFFIHFQKIWSVFKDIKVYYGICKVHEGKPV